MTTKPMFDSDAHFKVKFDSSSSTDTQFDSEPSTVTIEQVETEKEMYMKFDSPDNNLDVVFEMTGGSYGEDKILYNTTEYWDSHRGYISKKGYIYIYSDYLLYDNKTIAGIKVGDGSTYLIDLPFLDKLYYDHIGDMVSHITQAEREFWNNKVTSIEEGHTLRLTKN